MTCDECNEKENCAFYEQGAEECVYEYLCAVHDHLKERNNKNEKNC